MPEDWAQKRALIHHHTQHLYETQFGRGKVWYQDFWNHVHNKMQNQGNNFYDLLSESPPPNPLNTKSLNVKEEVELIQEQLKQIAGNSLSTKE